MEARIGSVIDLAFGDFGKGVTVSNLVLAASDSSDVKPLVIRYCGGHQAGHTVIYEGKRHVFASFGSGTLQGSPTYFSQHTMFYLPNLLREAKVLNELGVSPTLYIDPLAMVTTPYDVAWNRVTEEINKHGSCGVGIAATMERNLLDPCKLLAADLFSSYTVIAHKLQAVFKYYSAKVAKEGNPDFDIAYAKAVDEAAEDWASMGSVSLPGLRKQGNMYLDILCFDEVRNTVFPNFGIHNYIFEGAQGIMLDQDHGLHPHTTYGYCTHRNVAEIINSSNWSQYNDGILFDAYYGTRCYQTRHGNGPTTCSSSNEELSLVNNENETNTYNKWQGPLLIGELDPSMLGAAYKIDTAYKGRCLFPGARTPVSREDNLVMTCFDQRPDITDRNEFIEEMVKKTSAFDSFLPNPMRQWLNDSPHTGHMQNRFYNPIGLYD